MILLLFFFVNATRSFSECLDCTLVESFIIVFYFEVRYRKSLVHGCVCVGSRYCVTCVCR